MARMWYQAINAFVSKLLMLHGNDAMYPRRDFAMCVRAVVRESDRSGRLSV
jgi:hypothetical protein